jgi:hypothetical protein
MPAKKKLKRDRKKKGKKNIVKVSKVKRTKRTRKVRRVRKSRKYGGIKRYGGVSLCRETGSFVTDKNCVYVQHSSLNVNDTLLILCQAIVQELFKTINPIVNFEDLVITGTNQQFKLFLTYYESPSSTSMSTFATVLTISSTTKFVDVVAALQTYIQSIYISLEYTDAQLEEVRLISPVVQATGGAPVDFVREVVRLRGAYVNINGTSTLKLQNRTQSTLGTESDEVDNTPLVGRVYIASGNQMQYIDRARNSLQYFICANGAYTYSGGLDTTKVLNEPPAASMFSNCKKSMPVTLKPGEVKSATISYKRKMSIKDLMREIFKSNNPTNIPIFNIGNTQLFAFEKMLETLPDASRSLLNVGFEANQVVHALLTQGMRYSTVPRTIV